VRCSIQRKGPDGIWPGSPWPEYRQFVKAERNRGHTGDWCEAEGLAYFANIEKGCIDFIKIVEESRPCSSTLQWRRRIPHFLIMLEAILCLARRGIECYTKGGIDEEQVRRVCRQIDRRMVEATKRMAPYVNESK